MKEDYKDSMVSFNYMKRVGNKGNPVGISHGALYPVGKKENIYISSPCFRKGHSYGVKMLLLTFLVPIVMAASHAQAFSYGPFKLEASYRFRSNMVKNIPVDYKGDRLGQRRFEEQRLRLRPELHFSDAFSIHNEIDFFSGLLSGDRANPVLATEREDRTEAHGRSRIDLRQLYADISLPFGFVHIGQVAAHWGLGIVANDGEPGQNDFGDEYFGSLYDQILFGTKPFLRSGGLLKDVVTAAAINIVYRDPLADFVRGDEGNPADWELSVGDKAWQGILTLFNDQDGRRIGVYGVARRQRFESGGDLNAWVGDVYFDIRFSEVGRFKPYLQGEMVGVIGKSSEFANNNALKGADILQGGGVLRLGAQQEGLDFSIEGGYASGDRNPFDGKVTNFVFHPDYNVGMVMFDEVMNHFTAAIPTLLSDPLLLERAPGGIFLFPTNGGVTNALYIQTKLRNRLLGSSDHKPALDLILAHIYARSDQLLMDPANMTLESGGAATNFLGARSSSKDLGNEVDVGVRGHLPIGGVTPELGLEYGYFFPGKAFSTPSGARMSDAFKFRVLLTLCF